MFTVKNIKRVGFLAIVIITSLACKKTIKGETQIYPEPDPVGTYAKGADVSWVTEMEAVGRKFFNSAGVQQDLFTILKDKGINTIRLRVWVNPPTGYNNTADVLAKAKRAKAANMRLLIDFHYSDSWADPAQQNKPAGWVNQDFTTLKASVRSHTVAVLIALKAENIIPEWVQVVNETNDGMLWNDGKASVSMKNFAELIQAGYDGVKSVNPGSKVVVHISNGFDNSLFRWVFDGLKANGAKWDVVGMSLYPTAADWTTKNTQCLANMNDMVARYGSEVMICEVGMPVTDAVACRDFIKDIMAKNKSLTNNKGLGVFYWEPQSYNSWNGYKLGAFDDAGKPTVAMDAFLP